MEERQDNTKNVKILLQMLKDEKLKDLRENVKVAQGKASSIVKKLGEKENELKRKQRLEEEAEQRAAEADGSVEETTASDFVYDETPEMSVEVEPVRSFVSFTDFAGFFSDFSAAFCVAGFKRKTCGKNAATRIGCGCEEREIGKNGG